MNEDQNNPSGSTPPPAPVAADVPFPAAPPVSFVPPAAPISSVPPAPPFQPAPSAQSAPASQPGKGLAIAGIVLAFCMLQLIGLILSIVAKHKALKTEFCKYLGDYRHYPKRCFRILHRRWHHS